MTAGKIYLASCRAEWIKEQAKTKFGVQNIVTIVDEKRNAALTDWLQGVQWFTDTVKSLKKKDGCRVAILAGPADTYSLKSKEE